MPIPELRGAGGCDPQPVPPAWSSVGCAGIGTKTAFPSTPGWRREAALAGPERNGAKPPQSAPGGGRERQPRSWDCRHAGGRCLMAGTWLAHRSRRLAAPPSRAASPRGSVAETFPPAWTGGCFDVPLPRGEVRCPSYLKCKPYAGSLTEQTHR